jgi:hypothetical protein
MTSIPETTLRARQDYLEGNAVRAIRADTGFSLDRLYNWLDGARQADGTTLLPPIPRRRTIVRKERRAATRVALVERLLHATGVLIHSLEQRMAQAGYQANPEDARLTAMWGRTMRDLKAHDEQKPDDKKSAKSKQADADEFIPRNVDELRIELARRIDIIRRRRNGDPAGGS